MKEQVLKETLARVRKKKLVFDPIREVDIYIRSQWDGNLELRTSAQGLINDIERDLAKLLTESDIGLEKNSKSKTERILEALLARTQGFTGFLPGVRKASQGGGGAVYIPAPKSVTNTLSEDQRAKLFRWFMDYTFERVKGKRPRSPIGTVEVEVKRALAEINKEARIGRAARVLLGIPHHLKHAFRLELDEIVKFASEESHKLGVLRSIQREDTLAKLTKLMKFGKTPKPKPKPDSDYRSQILSEVQDKLGKGRASTLPEEVNLAFSRIYRTLLDQPEHVLEAEDPKLTQIKVDLDSCIKGVLGGHKCVHDYLQSLVIENPLIDAIVAHPYPGFKNQLELCLLHEIQAGNTPEPLSESKALRWARTVIATQLAQTGQHYGRASDGKWPQSFKDVTKKQAPHIGAPYHSANANI